MERPIEYGIFETQVLNLLKAVQRQHGDEVAISLFSFVPLLHVHRGGVTFTPLAYREKLASLRKELSCIGIDFSVSYVPLPRWSIYIKAIFFPIFLASALPVLWRVLKQGRFDIAHCRSYLPALLVAILKSLGTPTQLLFDPRAPLPEQGVVAGHYAYPSFMYTVWQRIEDFAVRSSTITVCVTDLLAREFETRWPFRRISVIHNTVDVDAFSRGRQARDRIRDSLGISGRTVFVYNGSLGVWNDPQMLAQVFALLERSLPNAFLLVLTRFDHCHLNKILCDHGVPPHRFKIVAIDAGSVPTMLPAGDYGLWPSTAFAEDDQVGRLHRMVTGIKTFEYLAGGLPIIANQNIEGVKDLIDKHGVGLTFGAKNLNALPGHLEEIHSRYETVSLMCQKVALDLASVQLHADCYCQLYRDMMIKSASTTP